MFRSMDDAAGYLSAIIDGEGMVCYHERERGITRLVQVFNTDLGIISAAEMACIQLGIPHYVRERDRGGDAKVVSRKRIFLLNIGTRAGFEALSKAVTLHAAEKQERLDAIIHSYSAETLRPKVLALAAEGLSRKEIQDRLGVAKSNVQYWLTVPRKQRGRPRAVKIEGIE